MKNYRVLFIKTMNKEEFITRHKMMEMTQSLPAQILDIPIKTVKACEMGKTEIPGLVAKVLRKMEDKVFRDGWYEKEFGDEKIAIRRRSGCSGKTST